MSRFAPAVLLMVFLFASPHAWAQAERSAEHEACMKQEMSQIEMGDCLEKERSRVAAELDKIAQNVIAESEKLRKEMADMGSVQYEGLAESFMDAQKKFNEFAQSHCQYVAETFGSGSGASAGYTGCLIDMINGRIKQLKVSG